MFVTNVAFATPDHPTGGSADAALLYMPDTLSRSYRHTEAVQRLKIERDTTGAREIWLDILAADSTYTPALYNLSRIERAGKALEYAERAYHVDSTNKWYVQNYATQLIAGHNYRESMPIYRTLLRLDPRNVEAYHALAILYASGGMPYSAIAILDSAEIRTGYNLYLASIKQRLLIDTRQYDKAIEDGQRIVREFPYDATARTTLALAYEASGCDSLARHSYEEAFRIDTTNIETLASIVDYYDRKGDVERMFSYERRIFRSESVSIEEKLRRLEQYTSDIAFYSRNYFNIGSVILGLTADYPQNRKVTDAYASHLIAAGEYDAAVELLRRHLSDEGTTDNEYLALLQLESYLHLDELIDIDLAAALDTFPRSRMLHTFAAFLRSERGDIRGGIEIMRRAIKLSIGTEELSESWGYLGDIYHSAEQDNKAFKAYRKALAYNEDNSLVLNNYAYYLSLLDRDLERALAMASRAVELDAGNATYVDTYAWVLHRLGRNKEAKVAMRQALSLSGQRDAALLAHYGDILWALGEKFMADTYWKKAVEVGYDAEEMLQHQQQLKNDEER